MPVERVIPLAWLTPAAVERIVVHWSAGLHAATRSDLEHYHFILQSTGGENVRPVQGLHTPADNEDTASDYAAHTKGLNTRSIGIAAACMADAREGGPYGKSPLTETLWERLAQATAELCDYYQLAVTNSRVLQHGEVEETYGIDQRGKWDCMELPWNKALKPSAVASEFRRKVIWYLEQMNAADAGGDGDGTECGEQEGGELEEGKQEPV